MDRRHFLRAACAAPALSLLGSADAAASDYRALIVLHLGGGNDGLNCLIPTDGAYNDYAAARPALAIPKASLVTLSGASAGHTFGMHPSMAPLATLYNQGRLAWIANAGPLVKPATARQVIEHTASVPSFLLSHSDQTLWQQGWTGDADLSGWGGRALELLPTALRNELNAVTMGNDRTLVLGRQSPVSFLSANDLRYWGSADLARPQDIATQSINRMTRWQFANKYEAEYAATFGRSVQESASFTSAAMAAGEPKGNFGDNELGRSLRKLASLLPVFKSRGYKRQVFLIVWGQWDTHTSQRGSTEASQDSQLITLSKELSEFDKAIVGAGMDQNVATLSLTDFGRTLRPASGGGSDHAWGNHIFAMGGPVAGGQVHGIFPTLTLGGPDDCDDGKGGRFVPTTSTDQVAARMMQWIGLPDDQITTVFPYLANFSQKTLNVLRT